MRMMSLKGIGEGFQVFCEALFGQSPCPRVVELSVRPLRPRIAPQPVGKRCGRQADLAGHVSEVLAEVLKASEKIRDKFISIAQGYMLASEMWVGFLVWNVVYVLHERLEGHARIESFLSLNVQVSSQIHSCLKDVDELLVVAREEPVEWVANEPEQKVAFVAAVSEPPHQSILMDLTTGIPEELMDSKNRCAVFKSSVITGVFRFQVKERQEGSLHGGASHLLHREVNEPLFIVDDVPDFEPHNDGDYSRKPPGVGEGGA